VDLCFYQGEARVCVHACVVMMSAQVGRGDALIIAEYIDSITNILVGLGAYVCAPLYMLVATPQHIKDNLNWVGVDVK
jgi:hypothetical protein